MNAVDRIVTLVAAVAAPILGLLVNLHVIAATTSVDIGSIVAAAVGAYHGGKLTQKRQSKPKPAATAVVVKDAGNVDVITLLIVGIFIMALILVLLALHVFR